MDKSNVHMYIVMPNHYFATVKSVKIVISLWSVVPTRLRNVYYSSPILSIKTRMVMPVDITYMTSDEFLKQIKLNHDRNHYRMYFPNVSLSKRLFCSGDIQ